jgi:hypothetical protein
MQRSIGPGRGAPRYIVPVALLLAGCILPSESAETLTIEVASTVQLIRGDTVPMAPVLLDAAGVAVANATFGFASSDERVAFVDRHGTVVGANEGTAAVTVTSPSAETVVPVSVNVTVLAAVGIDSLQPKTVRYGEELRLFGRGLDPASGALTVAIEGVPVPIVRHLPVDSTRPERDAVLAVRIVPPLRTAGEAPSPANVTVTGSSGAASATLPLAVEPRDIFEPNALAPASLGVVSERTEWIGLAFEPPDTIAPADWYTFSTTATGDWTVALTWGATVEGVAYLQVVPDAVLDVALAPVFGGKQLVFYPNGASTMGATPLCGGAGVFRQTGGAVVGISFTEGSGTGGPGTTSLTLEDLPAGTHNLMILGAYPAASRSFAGIPGTDRWGFRGYFPSPSFQPQRYDLTIEPGSQTVVAPDAYEPNDVCEVASTLFMLGATVVTDSVIDLTSDGDWDNDWMQIGIDRSGTLEVAYDAIEPSLGLSGALVTAAATPGDSAWYVAGFYGAPDGRWDEALKYCAPDPDAVPNFSCPDGEMLTELIAVDAGTYHLLVQPRFPIAAPYALRFSWTPDPPAPSNSGGTMRRKP